jgi:putative SOS response-associated peptidase YedK
MACPAMRKYSRLPGCGGKATEWGDVYTLVMVDGHPQMAEVHDRMPLILSHAAQRYWLERTAVDDALDAVPDLGRSR